MTTFACPDCPECGHPITLLVGSEQAFCETDSCPVFMWNPSLTRAETVAPEHLSILDLNFLDTNHRAKDDPDVDA